MFVSIMFSSVLLYLNIYSYRILMFKEYIIYVNEEKEI